MFRKIIVKDLLPVVKNACRENILLTFFFVLINLLCISGGFAQNRQIIKGTVLNKLTLKPVAFANISVENTARGTVTDSLGHFEIIVPNLEKQTLVVSHINFYKQKTTTEKSLENNFRILLKPKSERLSDVVVSASLYEQPMDKLTRSAAVISHRQILDNMNSNVIDMLATTPGFTKVWEYHSPVILRGLNSNRLIIMKDGNRRIGTFPGGYFGQDQNIYDTKKVEIIKGPGSVIYGSGAISGIINIISNEPFGHDETNVKVSSGYGSNNNEFLELVTVCHKSENFGISVNGKYRKTGDMVYGDGKTSKNSAVEDRDLSLNTGVRFAEKHTLKLNVNYHYGDWGKPRGFNGSNKAFTKINNEEENIHTSLNYSFEPNGRIFKSLQFNLFYDDGKRDYYQYKHSTVTGKLSSLDLVHYKDNYGGGRLFSIFELSKNNKLTAGADAYLFRLDNPSDIIDYYNDTKGTSDGYKNAGQQDWGVFVNDEWTVDEKIRILTGVRYDAAKVVEGKTKNGKDRNETREAVSGNVGLVYSPQPDMHFSVNAGRAFRMPTAEELFTTVISCKGVKAGNPDAEAENSWNFDLGWRGKAAQQKLKYDLALFYNQIDSYIKETADTAANVDFTFENVDADIMGGECSLSYLFSNVVKASNTLYAGLGVAYVYGIDKSGERDKPLFGIPPFKANLELKYRGLLNRKWITGYFIKTGAEYAAEQNRVPEIPAGTDGGPWGYVPSESHVVFNIALGLNSNALPGSPKLRLIVKNLLDNDYQPYGSYIPAMGRNVKVLLSFGF